MDITQELELELEDVEIEELEDDQFKVRFVTSRGVCEGILHHREDNTAGAILIGGAGGGFNGPASIYPELSERLLEMSISALRLDFRFPNDLEECVLDALLGIELLSDLNLTRLGLAGWSFGGAVVVIAGVLSEEVKAVATVASQTYGTGSVGQLSPKALLVIHGNRDRTLPVTCSEDIYNRAKEPKELVIYEGANHGVDQKRNEMLDKIDSFFVSWLSADSK